MIAEADEAPTFILGPAREIEVREKRLRGDLDQLARTEQTSAEAAVDLVKKKVEALRRLVMAPVVQAGRSCAVSVLP